MWSKQIDSPVGPGDRRYVVICADDLGAAAGVNAAIRQAYQAGAITCSCLLATGPAYHQALEQVVQDCSGLGVGVHLTTEVGRPCSTCDRALPLLDERGQLSCGFGRLWRLSRQPAVLDALRREFTAQIERVLADGVAVDHLNGHRHIQMIPAVFRLVSELAEYYAIPAVRVTTEPLYTAGGLTQRLRPLTSLSLAKHLLLNHLARSNQLALNEYGVSAPNQLIGVLYTGHLDRRAIKAGLQACIGPVVEVVAHLSTGDPPGSVIGLSPKFASYLRHPQRQRDLAELTNPQLGRFLDRAGWTKTTFSDLWARSAAKPTCAADPSGAATATDRTSVACPSW